MTRHRKRIEALEEDTQANHRVILVVDTFNDTGEPFCEPCISHAWSSELGLVERGDGETEQAFRERIGARP